MKKLIVCLLSAALCVSLASCGGETPSAPAEEADTPALTADAEGTTDAESAADTESTADAEAAAEAADPADGGDTEGADGAMDGEPATEAEAAYQEKIAELRLAGEGEEVHWAVLPCGSGEKLLLAASSVYADGEAMEADVYQYADGEVRLIASVSSTGTAYPLIYTADAVLFGGNHTSGKLVVADGRGELSQITSINIEGKAPVLEVYDMENGEGTLKSSQELTAEEAEDMEFYMNALAGEAAEIILFQ